MDAALTRSLVDALLRLQPGAGADAGNRLAVDGVTWGPAPDGGLQFGARQLEMGAVRLAAGPIALSVDRLLVTGLSAQIGMDAGAPRLRRLQAAVGELSGVKVAGPLTLRQLPGVGAVTLGPLAAAEGTIRAEIVDAHLMFDANVTVPIRQGQVRFNDATVEHVGPDSRMGVSRMGLYVDAANGRSYLYQFPATPVAGVEFEHRGALLGPFVSDRGKLRLQEFLEGLLRQPTAAHGTGLTEQSRLLFERTAMSGDVQLGDGAFAAGPVRADVVGSAQGRNAVRLRSKAVGRGITAEVPLLSARKASLALGQSQATCDEMAGSVAMRLFVENGQPLRFELALPALKLTGLRLAPGPASA